MTGNKDSVEVAQFMALFSKLKRWADDTPDELLQSAGDDESIRELCLELQWAAYSLRESENRSRNLFVAPVDPKFLEAWRDYEERYEELLDKIFWADFLPDFAATPIEDRATAPKIDGQWEIADLKADTEAEVIEAAIEFAYEQATQEHREFPEGFPEQIQDGRDSWERLKVTAGFDLRGAFRRRKLIPFVLIPRHVAAKQGDDDELSMLENLRQAHDAFVFGAPFAALALMRSIMEAVLRDHYSAEGSDVSERIKDAGPRLPRGASAAALHGLRRLANAVLHLDVDRNEILSKLDSTRLEKEVISLLLALRSLIEGAPRSGRRDRHLESLRGRAK